MTFKKYKFAVFSALVLSMIIPFAGINMAHAAQTTVDPAIQEKENEKLYYLDPVLHEQYQSASDNFFNYIQTQHWKGKSSLDDKKNAFPLVGLGVDGKSKAVEITLWKGIEHSTNASKYIAEIGQFMPKNVPWYVDYSEYATPASCTGRTAVCSPLIGGIEIGIKIDATTDKGCTLGYKATRNIDGASVFVTAGHCGAGRTGNDVHQPGVEAPGSTTIGTASTTVYSNGSDCDCGLVKLNNGVSISDAIFNTGSSTYTPTSVTTQNSQPNGGSIQQSGITSGIQTGTIIVNDWTQTYNDGVTIQHLVKASMTVADGDSGAPVTNGARTSLYGNVSGFIQGTSTSFYSPENRAAADLGVTIVVG